MLVAVVKKKEWEYSKMEIDMSQAFNTIIRKKLIDVMKDAKFSEDEIKMVKYLITIAKLQTQKQLRIGTVPDQQRCLPR